VVRRAPELEEILAEELRLRPRNPARIPGVGTWIPLLADRGTLVDSGDLVADRSVGDLIDLELDGTFAGVDEQDEPTRIEWPWVASQMDANWHTSSYDQAYQTDRRFTTMIEVAWELLTTSYEPGTAGDFVSCGWINSSNAAILQASGFEWQGAGSANRRGYLQTNGTRDSGTYGSGAIRGVTASSRTGASATLFDAAGDGVFSPFEFGGFNPWVDDDNIDPIAFWAGLVGAGRVQARGWYRAVSVLNGDAVGKWWER